MPAFFAYQPPSWFPREMAKVCFNKQLVYWATLVYWGTTSQNIWDIDEHRSLWRKVISWTTFSHSGLLHEWIIAWVVDGQIDSYHWQFRNMYPSFMRWITLKQRNSRGLTPQICTIPLPKLCQLFSHINRRVDFQGKWQKFVLTSNFAFLVNDKRSWKYFWRMQ